MSINPVIFQINATHGSSSLPRSDFELKNNILVDERGAFKTEFFAKGKHIPVSGIVTHKKYADGKCYLTGLELFAQGSAYQINIANASLGYFYLPELDITISIYPPTAIKDGKLAFKFASGSQLRPRLYPPHANPSEKRESKAKPRINIQPIRYETTKSDYRPGTDLITFSFTNQSMAQGKIEVDGTIRLKKGGYYDLKILRIRMNGTKYRNIKLICESELDKDVRYYQHAIGNNTKLYIPKHHTSTNIKKGLIVGMHTRFPRSNLIGNGLSLLVTLGTGALWAWYKNQNDDFTKGELSLKKVLGGVATLASYVAPVGVLGSFFLDGVSLLLNDQSNFWEQIKNNFIGFSSNNLRDGNLFT